MISKEDFIKYLDSWQEFESKICEIESVLQVDLYESDLYGNAFDMLSQFLHLNFTDDAVDTIGWYLWEDVDKVIYITEDLFEESRKVYLNSLSNLYDFFMTDLKFYFKNV